ncbi:alpha/beta hydrolase [Agrococcus sp. BE272]|uniref:alpha/beta fold hydrolase n=1 Tax=Agrococcus sp. BE272 TaxID=2817727 RepID=UPI002863EC31|nr:alpha/beta hydrolase [Agrococcus sp. BE272]MDR7234745.1 pimeloyl-ACP methyl ester carboxylesterase [Agrococcus sp. BE272]
MPDPRRRHRAPRAGRTRRERIGDLEFRVSGDLRERPGPREAIVLVHGIGMSQRAMHRLHRTLRPGALVLSIDMPGHAGLPVPRREVDVLEMAGALGALLARLGLPPVVLVGHSMGAQWAVELAVQRPELVSRVVAIAPVVDAARRSVREQLVALLADAVREPPSLVEIACTDYLRCGVAWYAAQLRQTLAYPIERRLPVLRRPLLIVRGAHDTVAGEAWCRALRDAAPDAALVRIPGHHHAAQHSAPRAVAAAIVAHR